MLRTLLLLAMAYGVRRNEANGDCPGFKGDGVCEWGATRKSDGRGRVTRGPVHITLLVFTCRVCISRQPE